MTRALRQPILLILAAFLALGALFLWQTPPFEAPDEYGHYAYVRYLAEERRLPPLVVSADEWEQGQMHQPPLYYLLGALLVGRMDSGGWQAAYPRNEFAALGEPGIPGNTNAALHPATPTAATQRTATALRALRAWSLACSAATVWLTYRLALTIAPRQRWLAWGSAAVLAFNPQFLFISASVNNDVLVTALVTAVLLLSARVARQGGHPWRTPVLLGTLGGLAALSKLSGLASLLLVPCAYLIHSWQGGRARLWPDLLRPVLLAGGAAALVGGGWYLRNALAYGDPLGMRQYAEIFAVHGPTLPLQQAASIAGEALPSYWGVFGWMNVLAPEPYYWAVRALTALAGLGLLLRVMGAWRSRSTFAPGAVRAGAVAGLWGLVMLALILRWTQTITRTQGRLLFPAGGVLAFLLVLGVTGWVASRWRAVTVLGLSLSLMAVSAAVPGAVIRPAYALPPRIQVADLPTDLSRLMVRFGQRITLLGAEVESAEAVPGGTVWVRLYWRAEAPLDESYVESVQLVGPQGESLGGRDTLPAMGLYPTDQWVPGEVVVDECAIPVAADARGPAAASVRVGLYADRYDQGLAASDPAGADLGASVEVGRVRLPPSLPWDGAAPSRRLLADLGGLVRLHGYDLGVAPAADGAAGLTATLYWECLAPVAEAYTVYVHLLDREGNLLAQADGPPREDGFPTTFWQIGDRVRDPHELDLPADAAWEGLTLHLGLYQPESGDRLAVEGGDAVADGVAIGPFSLTAEGVSFEEGGG